MRYARFRQLIARNRYPKASVLIQVPGLVIDIVEALATIQDHTTARARRQCGLRWQPSAG